MPGTTPQSNEIRRAFGCHADGLLDLFLGLTLLDAWTALRDPSGALSGGAVVMLFPLLLAAKRAITVPRLPPADTASPAAPPRPRAFGRLTFVAVVGAAVLLPLAVGALVLSASGATGSHAWELVALAGLGAVAAAGLRLAAARFVVYASLASVALALGVHSHLPHAAYLTPVLAAGMVSWGGVLLMRFLATGPRAA